MKDKFNKLYNLIMEDLRDDLKENQEYELDVNYPTVFRTLDEIIKNADPKALQELHSLFEKYEGSNDRQACCDIMEGDGWGAWTGLMDPKKWEDMGFNLTPTQKKILTIYNDDVNNGAFYDFEDSEVEMTKDFMIKAGAQDIVDSFN